MLAICVVKILITLQKWLLCLFNWSFCEISKASWKKPCDEKYLMFLKVDAKSAAALATAEVGREADISKSSQLSDVAVCFEVSGHSRSINYFSDAYLCFESF